MHRIPGTLVVVVALLYCSPVLGQAPPGAPGGPPIARPGASIPGLPTPRDTRSAPQTGTARVSGRVVSTQTGSPLRRAQFRCSVSRGRRKRGARRRLMARAATNSRIFQADATRSRRPKPDTSRCSTDRSAHSRQARPSRSPKQRTSLESISTCHAGASSPSASPTTSRNLWRVRRYRCSDISTDPTVSAG